MKLTLTLIIFVVSLWTVLVALSLSIISRLSIMERGERDHHRDAHAHHAATKEQVSAIHLRDEKMTQSLKGLHERFSFINRPK